MLESFNQYVSFIVLSVIILGFLFVVLAQIFKSVEKSRIEKAMLKREKEQKGE